MHPSVAKAFPTFSRPLEGEVASMYADIKGLITTGVGCLIDPISLALPLPWRHGETGQLATQPEIAAAWNELKSQKDKFAKLHWKYAAALNDLRLDQEAIDDLMHKRLLQNEKVLRSYFQNFDAFPADAQLGLFSMAWALGAAFPATFGNLRAAAQAQNWTSAIAACKIREDNNPGIVPRNAQNRLCFANAAAVIAQGLPLDELHWPVTTPSASQRDQALRTEAEQAAVDHEAHNNAAWDALTIKLREGLDLNHRDDDDSEPGVA